MTFNYTEEFLETGITYSAYRQAITNLLALPPVDEAAEKMRNYIRKNAAVMDRYDQIARVTDRLRAALQVAEPETWLVITEPWCGDAAFNVPLMAAIGAEFPAKVRLLLFMRDSNMDLIDANLTDGGRSIPKLVILNSGLQPVASWGPRPAGLQELMKGWKEQGLQLKELIPKVHQW